MCVCFKEKNEELRLHIVQTYRQVAKKEHARILQRRQIIEERKEELEILNQQRVMLLLLLSLRF